MINRDGERKIYRQRGKEKSFREKEGMRQKREEMKDYSNNVWSFGNTYGRERQWEKDCDKYKDIERTCV